MQRTLKIISLLSYSLIILRGSMIGIPLIMWLVFTSFDFGNIDQPFALLGLIGLIINFTKYSKSRSIKILSFVLMLTPLIRRVIAIDIKMFNYLAFIIPFSVFVITYLILIVKPKWIENKTK